MPSAAGDAHRARVRIKRMGHVYRGAVRAFCIVLVAYAHGARAAPGELADLPEVKLADIVTVAVRQSPDLSRARIDLDAARAQLTRAQGAEDTHLGLEAQTTNVYASRNDPGGDSSQNLVSLSVSRALPTGGTLGLAAVGQ